VEKELWVLIWLFCHFIYFRSVLLLQFVVAKLSVCDSVVRWDRLVKWIEHQARSQETLRCSEYKSVCASYFTTMPPPLSRRECNVSLAYNHPEYNGWEFQGHASRKNPACKKPSGHYRPTHATRHCGVCTHEQIDVSPQVMLNKNGR